MSTSDARALNAGVPFSISSNVSPGILGLLSGLPVSSSSSSIISGSLLDRLESIGGKLDILTQF